jgi:hypothetical protein
MAFNPIHKLRDNIEAIRVALAYRPGDALSADDVAALRKCAYRTSIRLYKGNVCSPFPQRKDGIPRHLQPGSCVITFCYHSIVMAKGRGFKLEQLAVFSHGGAMHDTLASVEGFNPP